MSIEARILAAIIGNGEPDNLAVQKAMLHLSESCFEISSLREVFVIVQKLFHRKERFDVEQLMSIIPDSCYQSFTEIATMSSGTFTNLLDHDVDCLLKIKKRRLMERKINQMVHDFHREIIPDLACEKAVEHCLSISRFSLDNSKHVFTSEEMAEKIFSGDYNEDAFIPTGIDLIDRQNKGGFKNKSLITIAGRPSTGKSCFAVFLAEKIAFNHPKKHVLFFSLEMTAYEVHQMHITSLAKRQFKELSNNELLKATSRSLDCPFTIDEQQLSSIDYIETFSRITNTQKPVGVIVVDYLSVVQNEGRFESNALKLADITMRLAALAKELDCIVIALSQVNRDYANRQDKCPVTTDAADSSGSERSSSYWIGIHRPCLDDQNDRTLKNTFVVKCRKHRWGDPWTAYFAFNNATFGNVDQHFFDEKQKINERQSKYKNKNLINEAIGEM